MNDTDYETLCEEHADWLSGWSCTHDYDPTWDYTVCFQYRGHPLYLLACEVLERICADASTNEAIPFSNGRVYPAELDGAAAVYISGTSSEPVVLVDIACHLEELDDDFADGESLERMRREAVADSVLHELRHAVQESYDMPPSEIEAEFGSDALPF